MAHFPKPFFKQARQLWYVEIDRKQHCLGPDKDEAFRQYHVLMQSQKTASLGQASAGATSPLVAVVAWFFGIEGALTSTSTRWNASASL